MQNQKNALNGRIKNRLLTATALALSLVLSACATGGYRPVNDYAYVQALQNLDRFVNAPAVNYYEPPRATTIQQPNWQPNWQRNPSQEAVNMILMQQYLGQ